jgi:hypothetical protein
LYICKSIVEAHGGKIRAENNNIHGERGATFTFTLPSTTSKQHQQQNMTSAKTSDLLKSINVYCYFIKQKIEEESFFGYDIFLSQYGYN